jgi:hypothetical protein
MLLGKIQLKKILKINSSFFFRLFLSHFILKKSSYTELVHHRCQIAIDRLSVE